MLMLSMITVNMLPFACMHNERRERRNVRARKRSLLHKILDVQPASYVQVVYTLPLSPRPMFDSLFNDF